MDTTHSTVVMLVKKYQTEKTKKINLSGQLRYVIKYIVREMSKSLLKYHCYCPMVLMRTTKTGVYLQPKAIFHHLYGF